MKIKQQWREEDKVKWEKKKPWIEVKGEARGKNDHMEQMRLGDRNLSYALSLPSFLFKVLLFLMQCGPYK